MSDSPAPASPGGSKTTIYLLGAVAVLLVVIVAIVIAMQQNKTVTQDTPTTTQSSTATGTPTGAMPGVGQSAGAAFDPATGTKVPAGEKPDAYVKRYYQAILDKKWDVAFTMQPATSQQGGTVADFEQTQTGYGMTAFKVLSASEQGDAATVEVEQDLGANGTWGVVWSFVKYEGDWVVQARKVQMKP